MPDFPLRLGAAAEDPALPESSPPTLVGLAGQTAYLKGAQDQAVTNVRIGETFEGWRLARVGSRSVSLSNGSRSLDLSLFEQRPPVGALATGSPPSTTP